MDTPRFDQVGSDWIRETRQRRRAATEAAWKMMAGEDYDLLISDMETTLSMMRHSKSGVRLAALTICRILWRCEKSTAYLENSRFIAESDPDARCRESAIAAIGLSLAGTRDRGAQSFLARLLVNSNNSVRLRNASYLAIRQIEDGPKVEYARWPHASQPSFETALMEIDWQWVAKLADNTIQ